MSCHVNIEINYYTWTANSTTHITKCFSIHIFSLFILLETLKVGKISYGHRAVATDAAVASSSSSSSPTWHAIPIQMEERNSCSMHLWIYSCPLGHVIRILYAPCLKLLAPPRLVSFSRALVAQLNKMRTRTLFSWNKLSRFTEHWLSATGRKNAKLKRLNKTNIQIQNTKWMHVEHGQ